MGEQRAGYETSVDYGEPGEGRLVPRRQVLGRTGPVRPVRKQRDDGDPVGGVLDGMTRGNLTPRCAWRQAGLQDCPAPGEIRFPEGPRLLCRHHAAVLERRRERRGLHA